MEKVYACLVGDWVCLNDDPTCEIGENHLTPSSWWKEKAEIWNPKEIEEKNTLYQMPYVKIFYSGKGYRIHPQFIQIVEEP